MKEIKDSKETVHTYMCHGIEVSYPEPDYKKIVSVYYNDFEMFERTLAQVDGCIRTDEKFNNAMRKNSNSRKKRIKGRKQCFPNSI